MANRSPILGYNHNIRHRGVVFHVQTEDSGIKNPHLFTHLFHGGVIISSRKLVYDADADEEIVKSLMQAQHKAMLKDLKTGKFTAKIDEYLAGNPDLVPSSGESDLDQRASTEPFQRVDLEEIAAAGLGTAPTLHMPEPPGEVSEAFSQATHSVPAHSVPTQPPAQPATSGVPSAAIPIATPIAATEAMKVPGRGQAPQLVPSPSQPSDAAQQPVTGPPPVPARRAHSAPARRAAPPPRQAIPPARAAGQSQPRRATQSHRQRSSQSNVVVSRPAVIVGAPSRVVGGSSRGNSTRSPSTSHPTRTSSTSPRPAAKVRNSKDSGADSLFGQGLISEKSLDEVILAYLSEDGADD